MKKLLSLLFITVAAMLPKSVWAQEPTTDVASLVGTTLTIKSSAAGKLSANPSGIANFSSLSDEQKNSVTEIKLVGYFNANDLTQLKGDIHEGADGPFTGVKVVDMEEAYFTKDKNSGTPSSYMWFLNSPTGSAGSEAHAWSSGSLYQLQYPRIWQEIYTTPTSNVTSYASVSDMNSDLTGNVGRYAKTAKNVYRQMTINSQSWTFLGVNKDGNVTPFNVSWLGNVKDDHLSEYQNGDNVRVYEYYQVVKINEEGDNSQSNLKWSDEPVYPSNAEIETAWGNNKMHVGEWVEATYGALVINDYCHLGDYIRFDVYYRKVDNRSWSDPATDNDPGSAINADFLDSERNNNMRYANGAWVRMVAYSYYRLDANTGANASLRNWVLISNSENQNRLEEDYVKFHFDDINGSDATSAKSSGNDGDYAVVGGSQYVYDGNSWVTYESWSSSSYTFNYSDMKFDYWSETLEKATTSRYANESISDGIFANCFHLTEVNYLGGNVTGFGDHKTEAGYIKGENGLKVTIGKDVTKIDNAAFRRCDLLTAVEWDTYTEDEKNGNVYPKELVIDNEAFMQARYLTSITIPNRVTYIGNKAFEQVGNCDKTNYDQVKNDSEDTHEFKLTFERRSSTDDDDVAISCDKALTLGSQAFFDCWYLRNLSLPIRLESMGEECFKNSYQLTELIMREETDAPYEPTAGHDLLRTIPSGAFEYSGVQQLTIPRCVTKIENHAFGTTTGLTKVTFQNNTETTKKDLLIESGAFAGGTESGRPKLDIYVMVNPNDRKIICEYGAFNYTQTVGQTSVSGSEFAYLHFPEECWDYYQGNWKRGLAFRQDNLNAFKDGYYKDNDVEPDYVGKSAGVISSSTGKYMTADNNTATIYTPGNGWQEFARTSTNIDIEIPNTGTFLRTYSTPKPMVIPLYAEDDTQQKVKKGDPFFKIYRVSHFYDGWVDGDTNEPTNTPTATATEVKQHYKGEHSSATDYQDSYIPKETGLLMAGTGSGTVSYLLYMAEVDEEVYTSLDIFPFTQDQHENVAGDVAGTTNLLWPSCVDDGKGTITTQGTENEVEYVYLNPTYPYPYNASNPLQFRFFGLGHRTENAGTQNEHKEYFFSRFKEGGRVTRDKAYLRLTNDVFQWKNGHIGSGTVDPNTTAVNPSRVALNFFDDDEESGTTAIKQVDTTMQRTDSNVFYTLEGVKLTSRPTQRGIYIHNGRKVVIK